MGIRVPPKPNIHQPGPLPAAKLGTAVAQRLRSSSRLMQLQGFRCNLTKSHYNTACLSSRLRDSFLILTAQLNERHRRKKTCPIYESMHITWTYKWSVICYSRHLQTQHWPHWPRSSWAILTPLLRKRKHDGQHCPDSLQMHAVAS